MSQTKDFKSVAIEAIVQQRRIKGSRLDESDLGQNNFFTLKINFSDCQ